MTEGSEEEDRGNSFNHMSAKRPSRLAVTVAIALSSASGVGSRSPALVRGTRAPAVRLNGLSHAREEVVDDDEERGGGAAVPTSAAPVFHARSWRTIDPPTQYAEKYSLLHR